MNVFVAGGTGAIGGHAIPALVGAGHTVTALARTPKKAAALAKQGVQPVSISLFDRAALAPPDQVDGYRKAMKAIIRGLRAK